MVSQTIKMFVLGIVLVPIALSGSVNAESPPKTTADAYKMAFDRMKQDCKLNSKAALCTLSATALNDYIEKMTDAEIVVICNASEDSLDALVIEVKKDLCNFSPASSIPSSLLIVATALAAILRGF